MPLTPAEIQQMRGMPVWCEELSAYGIIVIDKIGPWANKPFLLGWKLQYEDSECGVQFEYDIEGRGLTLYRYNSLGKEC